MQELPPQTAQVQIVATSQDLVTPREISLVGEIYTIGRIACGRN